ncbi:MAG: hypothetical protein ABL930_13685, partial [Pseudobdellovibrio sp.]
MGIIKNFRFFIFLTLLSTLVITSHFSVFELLIACPHHHHTESATQADSDLSATACTHQHNCISSQQFILPVFFEISYTQNNIPKLNYTKFNLSDPVIDAPFHPP